VKDNKLKELLVKIEEKYKTLDFPSLEGDFPFDQLKLSFKAIVHDYKNRLSEKIKKT
jgi:hypothetical protein